jgi:hypothetical protein
MTSGGGRHDCRERVAWDINAQKVLSERVEGLLRSGEARMTTQDFIVQKLTTFAIAGGGTHLQMNFVCQDDIHVRLRLPTESLQALMMTLPRMMTQALQIRYRDESLRLVYPAENIRIELASDPKIIIVTLATPDGFEASFSLTRQQMRGFNAALDDLNTRGTTSKCPVN